MRLKMVESENTFAYMQATREYIERHGKRVAFYSDKHSVFRNTNATANGDGMTQFGRAAEALNIEIICAFSPQAKGRVERANATLQDRLVKAMRLEGSRRSRRPTRPCRTTSSDIISGSPRRRSMASTCIVRLR